MDGLRPADGTAKLRERLEISLGVEMCEVIGVVNCDIYIVILL